MTENPETSEQKTVGWHRHRWTAWGKPFGVGGLTAIYAGQGPPWWQERRCVVCNRAERAPV